MSARRPCISLALATALACSSTDDSLDRRISNVTVVGTRLGGTAIEVQIVPLDDHGHALLDSNAFQVGVQMLGPSGVSASVVGTKCVRQLERQPMAAGIVVDASSSMVWNDPDDATGPAPGRRRVVNAFVDTMQPPDVALLADFYGDGANPLRDLVCVATSTASPPPACLATAASLQSDTSLLRGATQAIVNHAGTPLYEACLQMADILGPQANARRAMIVLSDGAPTNDVARAQCLDASRSANVAIYTVGFGSGAEGPPAACPASAPACPTGWTCVSGQCQYDVGAVGAMRELSESTGGIYAPATDQARIQDLLVRTAYSEGFCTVTLYVSGLGGVPEGTPVDGEISAGKNGARATFGFLMPRAL